MYIYIYIYDWSAKGGDLTLSLGVFAPPWLCLEWLLSWQGRAPGGSPWGRPLAVILKFGFESLERKKGKNCFKRVFSPIRLA